MDAQPEPAYQLSEARVLRMVQNGEPVDVLMADVIRNGVTVGSIQSTVRAESHGPGRTGYAVLTSVAAWDPSLEPQGFGFRPTMRDKDDAP